MARAAHPTMRERAIRWVPPAPLVALALFASGFAVLVAVMGVPPFLLHEVDRARDAIGQNNPEVLRDYLRSFGPLAPLVSIGMMVAQAAIAPVPGFIVVFANGLAFGLLWGSVVSLLGYAAAAALCFWVARRWGQRHFQRLVGRLGLSAVDDWVSRSGAKAVFLLRLCPGFSFDGVSYAAGLTRLRFRPFLLASVAGSLPQVLLFVYLGERGQQHLLPMLVAGIVITVITTVAHWAWTWRSARSATV
ncbi:MAG: TVP38/TMEM64 family protein [Dehalococcoidia bacterium]|nr:TVP38/TMEM64 family protein [Dehalococcoidia bacterium]